MSNQRGQILIIINIVTSVLLVYSLALVNLTVTARNIEKKEDFKLVSRNIAEAGIQKAIWCFNQTEGSNCGGTYGGSYSGEPDISFGQGVLDINITPFDVTTKQIEAIGYFPDKTKTLSKTTIKTRVATDTDMVSFSYGAQVAEGGLQMDNNAKILGSVYANGNIDGSAGAEITGDVYVAGGTALTADQEHTTHNNDFVFGQTNPVIDLAQSFTPSVSDVLNKVSMYIKKVDSPSSPKVRIVADAGGVPDDDDMTYATLDSSTVSTNYGWIDVSFSNPPSLISGTKYWIVFDAGKSSTKYWTIGVDAFDNYAGGTMLYGQDWDDYSWTATGNDINFKTWMGGVTTYASNLIVGANIYAHQINSVTAGGNASVYDINGSTIGGNAWAYSIDSSTIGANASTTDITGSTVGGSLWCQTYSTTNVGGSTNCPTAITAPADPGPVDMPISDILISDWKTDAQNGGIIEGSQTISEDGFLGPKKINGGLTVSGGVTLTLTGTIYVTGAITVGNGAAIILDSSYGSGSGVIIADGIITIDNNVIFDGAGTGSHVLLLSTYDSPTESAIDVNNNATAALLFAPDGIIDITNNSTVKQVNAHKLKLSNNVVLQYESGLSSISFSSGPTGGWSELKGYWQIVE